MITTEDISPFLGTKRILQSLLPREHCSTSRGGENIRTAIELQQIGHDEPIPPRVHVNAIQRPRFSLSGHADEVQEAVSQRGMINQSVSQLTVQYSIEGVQLVGGQKTMQAPVGP